MSTSKPRDEQPCSFRMREARVPIQARPRPGHREPSVRLHPQSALRRNLNMRVEPRDLMTPDQHKERAQGSEFDANRSGTVMALYSKMNVPSVLFISM